MEKEKIDAFLTELKALSEKHGLFINDGSCGCCDYTHITDGEGKRLCMDMNMMYDHEKKKYSLSVNRE